MKILLTGDKGFIATKLKARLAEHEVIGYDIVDGHDLLNLETLEEAIKYIDTVFHIAAQADLTKLNTPEAGLAATKANVEATTNVAYLCAKYNKRLIYASTVCVYGNQEGNIEREDTTLPNPSELYAQTKYAAESIIKGFSQNFGNPYTILRFATIYGEGMRKALGVSIFFHQAIAGEPITVHGDGIQSRTQTYVGDLVDGIVAAFNHPEEARNQTFNLTSPKAVSALQMAKDIKELTGSSSEITFIPQRANQTMHESFDTSKAYSLIGWEAKTPWLEGLKKTYIWIRSQS